MKKKLPTAQLLPSGQYRCRVMVDGQRVSVVDADPKTAQAKAVAIQSGLIKNETSSGQITLGEAIDQYIAIRSNTLSPSTIRGYQAIRNSRFPKSMNINLKKMTDAYCKSMVNAEAAICSPKTLKNAWMFVSSCIFEATGEHRSAVLPQVPEADDKFLDYKQIEIFVKAVRETPAEIPALLALHSLRRSEIIALDWSNIDLEKQLIHVKGSMVFDRQSRLVEKRTNKNATSTRTVPILIPRLFSVLSAVERKSGKIVWQHPNTILRQINAVCVSSGLPPIGTHGLRHSFASLSYHLQIPEKICMEIGGWANDATMRRIYTHIARSDVSHYENKMQDFYKNWT